jgi:hypothetical protein
VPFHVERKQPADDHPATQGQSALKKPHGFLFFQISQSQATDRQDRHATQENVKPHGRTLA